MCHKRRQITRGSDQPSARRARWRACYTTSSHERMCRSEFTLPPIGMWSLRRRYSPLTCTCTQTAHLPTGLSIDKHTIPVSVVLYYALCGPDPKPADIHGKIPIDLSGLRGMPFGLLGATALYQIDINWPGTYPGWKLEKE